MNVSFKVNLFKDVDPNKVWQEIQTLGDALKPQDIVDAAQNPKTELHKCFEWDDTEAARKYRLTQARTLLVNLVVVESVPAAEPQHIRVMYTSKDGGYKQTKLIVQDKNEYEILLEKARSELLAFKKKYSMLQELHEIFELIN